MATTILVSCGRPSISRLLSMLQVIDAIAEARNASRSGGKAQSLERLSFGAVSGKRFALSKTAEKLLFNIGRLPVRQSRQPRLLRPNGKSCRRAEKGPLAGPDR